jgi:hypothetical protein
MTAFVKISQPHERSPQALLHRRQVGQKAPVDSR